MSAASVSGVMREADGWAAGRGFQAEATATAEALRPAGGVGHVRNRTKPRGLQSRKGAWPKVSSEPRDGLCGALEAVK